MSNETLNWNEGGFFVTPVTLSRVETVSIVVLLSQGIPVNLLIAVVISSNRRLHNPRNAFWLGIIWLNLLTMMMSVLLLLVVYLPPPQAKDVCLVFSLTTGKPYTILLFLGLLATVDRYAAITYPLWHRKHVTVNRVILIQVLCSLMIFASLLAPFIFKWIPLRCGFNLAMGKCVMLVRFIIVVLCISVQIAVYLQTRKYLKATVRSSAINSQVREESLRQTKSTAFFVHRHNKAVSKLELEASRTLLCGILPQCVIMLPMFVVYFGLSLCQATERVDSQCVTLASMIPYVRKAALVHAVYGPFIYIARSQEFRSALNKIKLPFSSAQSLNRFM